MTIATGPAKHRDKRGNCYRTDSNTYESFRVRDKGCAQPWNGSKAEINKAVPWVGKMFNQ